MCCQWRIVKYVAHHWQWGCPWSCPFRPSFPPHRNNLRCGQRKASQWQVWTNTRLGFSLSRPNKHTWTIQTSTNSTSIWNGIYLRSWRRDGNGIVKPSELNGFVTLQNLTENWEPSSFLQVIVQEPKWHYSRGNWRQKVTFKYNFLAEVGLSLQRLPTTWMFKSLEDHNPARFLAVQV